MRVVLPFFGQPFNVCFLQIFCEKLKILSERVPVHPEPFHIELKLLEHGYVFRDCFTVLKFFGQIARGVAMDLPSAHAQPAEQVPAAAADFVTAAILLYVYIAPRAFFEFSNFHRVFSLSTDPPTFWVHS